MRRCCSSEYVHMLTIIELCSVCELTNNSCQSQQKVGSTLVSFTVPFKHRPDCWKRYRRMQNSGVFRVQSGRSSNILQNRTTTSLFSAFFVWMLFRPPREKYRILISIISIILHGFWVTIISEVNMEPYINDVGSFFTRPFPVNSKP